MIRKLVKGLLLALVIGAFSAHSGLARRRRARSRLLSIYSRAALRVLGVRVQEIYLTAPPAEEIGRLIVCNHLSYLDVLVIASVYPSLFVTSVEVRDSPFLGWMAKLGGSLFVERRDRARLGQETAELSSAIRQGGSVVLFPEATSGNGDTVLPFRRAFFESAVATNCEILMLCMKYSRVNGAPIGPEVRDSVYYYGDLDFFPQLLALLGNREILVELRTLEVARPASGETRDSLCARAHAAISRSYHFPTAYSPRYQSSEA